DGESVLIETRAEGALAVAPGSPARTHNSGREYTIVWGDFSDIPTITLEQHKMLLLNCTAFDVNPNPVRKPKEKKDYISPEKDSAEYQRSSMRLIDEFNAKAEWEDILEPHGWSNL